MNWDQHVAASRLHAEAIEAANHAERPYMGLTVPDCDPGAFDLDSIRALWMIEMLNEDGRRYVGLYDVGSPDFALRLALYDQDHDNIKTGAEAKRVGKRYAFTGSGICDHYFSTPGELLMLCRWVCLSGYLSCYRKGVQAA